MFSAFVIEIHGEWFYITAGHILREIRRAMDAGSVFDVWRLDDQTAGNLFGGKAIPYDFNADEWLVLRDETNGLDYAAVHLGGLYRKLLQVGGVIPIAWGAWWEPDGEHDEWALVGVPQETVRYDGVTQIAARVVLVPLMPADPPTAAGQKAQNQVYAKVKAGEECPFEDARGLSGGPVFALKKTEGEWGYGIMGVQSAWYPESKILAICPFPAFGNAIAKCLRECGNYAEEKSVVG